MVSALVHFPKLILWPPLFNEYPTLWGSPECKYMHILLVRAERANNNRNKQALGKAAAKLVKWPPKKIQIHFIISKHYKYPEF
jgi:hypothetical protein